MCVCRREGSLNIVKMWKMPLETPHTDKYNVQWQEEVIPFRVVDSEVLQTPDTLEVITNTLDLPPELGTILLQKMP